MLTRSNFGRTNHHGGHYSGPALRAMSTNTVDYSLKAGWFVDLATHPHVRRGLG